MPAGRARALLGFDAARSCATPFFFLPTIVSSPTHTFLLVSLLRLAPNTTPATPNNRKMSAPDNEELIDYEDEHEVVTSAAAPSASNGAVSAAAPAADGDSDKKNFSGIHSTGFRSVVQDLLISSLHTCFVWRSDRSTFIRDFLLKPELLRAISDLGFEHPSEGIEKISCKLTTSHRIFFSSTGVYPSGCAWDGCTVPG